jgi:hypothetical protein
MRIVFDKVTDRDDRIGGANGVQAAQAPQRGIACRP